MAYLSNIYMIWSNELQSHSHWAASHASEISVTWKWHDIILLDTCIISKIAHIFKIVINCLKKSLASYIEIVFATILILPFFSWKTASPPLFLWKCEHSFDFTFKTAYPSDFKPNSRCELCISVQNTPYHSKMISWVKGENLKKWKLDSPCVDFQVRCNPIS